MTSTELTIPSSRIVDAAIGTLDLAGKVTRPLFIDVENVPSQGPFLLVGNHQLFAMQDVPYLPRGLDPDRVAGHPRVRGVQRARRRTCCGVDVALGAAD